MTPEERAFNAARADAVRGRTALLIDTRAEIVRLLRLALQQIQTILADQPSDYQRWSLPRLAQEIRQALSQFGEDAAATMSTAAGKGWQLGLDLVDKPLAAAGLGASGAPGAAAAAATAGIGASGAGINLAAISMGQLQAMRAFMTDRIKNVGIAAANAINSQLGLVVIGAQSPSDAISATRAILGEKSRARATTIVRTELSRVFAVAAHERLKEQAARVPGLQKQWRKSGKLHPRIYHDLADGQVQDVNDAFQFGNGARLMFPHDPNAPASEVINCLLPGALISGRAIGAMRACYRGKIVTVVTAQGFVSTVTPNHPILTARGFVAAAQLHEGEHLVCHRRGIEERPASGVVDIGKQNGPAPIEKIFSAFAKAGALRKIGREADFHGDGRSIDGEVEIVGPLCRLLSHADATAEKFDHQGMLKSPAVSASLLSSAGARVASVGGISRPASRSPSAFQLASHGIIPSMLEIAPDQATGFGRAAQIDASRLEPAAEHQAGDSRLIADLFQRFPREITLDQVTEIRNGYWSGHVYDLQSPFGWIIADGIFLSNCGCVMIPYKADWTMQYPGRSPGGLDIGPSIGELLDGGAPAGPGAAARGP